MSYSTAIISTNTYSNYLNAALKSLRESRTPTENFSSQVSNSHRNEDKSFLASRADEESDSSRRSMSVALGALSRIIATQLKFDHISSETGDATKIVQDNASDRSAGAAAQVARQVDQQIEVSRKAVEAMYFQF